MVKFSFILFLLLADLISAQEIERKIIIGSGRYYFTTIHQEAQIASLHTGKLTEKLENGEQFILPAGRNYDDPLIPFVWDVHKGFIYALNYLLHPMNDRFEALKRISISNLKLKDENEDYNSYVIQSTEMNPFAIFEPYRYIKSKSKILENFFFDGIQLNDSVYCMAISNQNKISFWKCCKKTWKLMGEKDWSGKAYFTLNYTNEKLKLISFEGLVYEINDENGFALNGKQTEMNFDSKVLIEDRDHNVTYFIQRNALDKSVSLNELIEKYAVKLF